MFLFDYVDWLKSDKGAFKSSQVDTMHNDLYLRERRNSSNLAVAMLRVVPYGAWYCDAACRRYWDAVLSMWINWSASINK